jgi:hypothetical protein
MAANGHKNMNNTKKNNPLTPLIIILIVITTSNLLMQAWHLAKVPRNVETPAPAEHTATNDYLVIWGHQVEDIEILFSCVSKEWSPRHGALVVICTENERARSLWSQVVVWAQTHPDDWQIYVPGEVISETVKSNATEK